MKPKNPLVASGVHVAEFSGAVTSHKRRATVAAGGQQVQLSARGARLLGELLSASADQVALIEDMLKTASSSQDQMISPSRAAELLGVSRPTVVRWHNEGLLPGQLVGSHHRFRQSDVLELRSKRVREAETAGAAARAARAVLVDQGVDLDVAPTPAELVEAGLAVRRGDLAAAELVFARARRADAREAAKAAGSPSGS